MPDSPHSSVGENSRCLCLPPYAGHPIAQNYKMQFHQALCESRGWYPKKKKKDKTKSKPLKKSFPKSPSMQRCTVKTVCQTLYTQTAECSLAYFKSFIHQALLRRGRVPFHFQKREATCSRRRRPSSPKPRVLRRQRIQSRTWEYPQG